MKVMTAVRSFGTVAMCIATFCLPNAPAFATAGTPIQGTPVGLDHDPQGIVARGTTDSQGNVVFRGLAPGRYTLVIDAKSLAAAIPAPAPKKKSGSSFSLGIGGFFGGGSGHGGSHQDAKGGPAYGHPGSSHSSSGGGVGLGVSIPIGGGDNKPDGTDGTPLVSVGLVVGAKGDLGGGWSISTTAPICRDSPGDLRIGFDVPEGGGGVGVSISQYVVGSATLTDEQK